MTAKSMFKARQVSTTAHALQFKAHKSTFEATQQQFNQDGIRFW